MFLRRVPFRTTTNAPLRDVVPRHSAPKPPDLKFRILIMPKHSNNDGRLFKLYAQGAGAIAFTVGLIVLSGWLLDINLLKSLLQKQATMRPNTALCFIFTVCALFI